MATSSRSELVLSDAVQLTALPHGGFVLVSEQTLEGVELTDEAAALLCSPEARRQPGSPGAEEFLDHACRYGWLVEQDGGIRR